MSVLSLPPQNLINPQRSVDPFFLTTRFSLLLFTQIKEASKHSAKREQMQQKGRARKDRTAGTIKSEPRRPSRERHEQRKQQTKRRTEIQAGQDQGKKEMRDGTNKKDFFQ